MNIAKAAKKDTVHVIIKNRRTKITAVYCATCMLRKRIADAADKKILQNMTRATISEVAHYGKNKKI